MLRTLLAVLGCIYVVYTPALAADMPPPQVCFTPGGQCTATIVREIEAAHEIILVQRSASRADRSQMP